MRSICACLGVLPVSYDPSARLSKGTVAAESDAHPIRFDARSPKHAVALWLQPSVMLPISLRRPLPRPSSTAGSW